MNNFQATSILNAIFSGVTSIVSLTGIFGYMTFIQAKVAAIEKAMSNANQVPPPRNVYPEKPDSVEDLYDSKKPEPYQPTQPVRPNPYNGWVYDEFAKSWKYKLPTNGWVFDEVTKSWKYNHETNGWVFDEASYSWKYRP